MAQNLKARVIIRVHARAKRTGIAGKLGEIYKLNVAAPAIDGKANEACRKYLAITVGMPLSSVRIVIGAANPSKVIEIEGVSQETLERSLRQAYESL